MKKTLLYLLTFGFMISAPICFATVSEQEKNKQVVKEFYQAAINDKSFERAEPYLGAWYIQHNPGAQDGIEGFKQFIQYLKNTYPQSHSEIKRIMAEKDYVILHVHSLKVPGTSGQAIIDIFRLEDNKIVEHWDVIQAIPDNPANGNGMF